MRSRTLRRGLLAAALILSSSACDGGKSSQVQPDPVVQTEGTTPTEGKPAADTPPTEAEPPATTPAKEAAPLEVALAASPDIDLVDNRYRWHLYNEGLYIPVASPGFRKYTQEYRRPFEDVITHAGKKGRVLSRRGATLRIPWEGSGAATARVWVHGVTSGQKVQINVNGKNAGTASVANEWGEVTIKIREGLLEDGENELGIFATKSARVGGEKTYGLFHAIEIVPGEASASGKWLPSSPATSEGDAAALDGFDRMVIYTEIPKTGWLEFVGTTTSGGKLEVRAKTTDAGYTSVFQDELGVNAKKKLQVDMSAFAGELVALEFKRTGDARWGTPRIGLEEAKIAAKPEPYKNVILLVVDALRSDRLDFYGDERVNTPRMTKEGVNAAVMLYNQAASPSSPPSHGSIQTGMIPRVHGVASDKAKLKPGTPMISTQLGDQGVSTAYYGNNPFGMARLESPGGWTEFHQPNKEGHGIDCVALTDGMLDFAKRQNDAGKRFFISSLPYEPHTPYRYHEGISEKYHAGGWGKPVGKSVDGYLLGDLVSGKVVLSDDQWSQLKALYDGEVEHMDECFAQLYDGLEERGILKDTAIILTSDHGEGMFEHGLMGHAFGHYSELADVPFVIYAPRLIKDGPRPIDTVTTHLDIAPTVLDLMGVQADRAVQGRSVLDFVLRDGPWVPRAVSLEYGKSYAVRAKRWKIIVGYGGDESLFDLQEDPTEQRDLIDKNDFALRYMRDLTGFFLEYRRDWKSSTWGDYNNHGPGFLKHVGE